MSDLKIEIVRNIGDGISLGTAAGTLMALLPPIAALFTIVWTFLRIYEMVVGLPFHKTPLMKKIRGEN